MKTKLDHELLGRFAPLFELDSHLLARLAQKANLLPLAQGRRLAAEQVERWFVYLNRGLLNVHYRDDGTLALAAGRPRAGEPLFGETDQVQSIEALEGSELVLADRQLYALLLEEQTKTGFRVQDLAVNDNEGELFRLVFAAMEQDALRLPSLPEVATRVYRMAERDDTTLADIGRVIQGDPSLAGRFLQLANSPLYRGVHLVNSISQAVGRLGLKTTRNLVLSLSLEQLFDCPVGILRQRMQQIWQQSIGVAAHAHALARRMPGMDPERAQLAGLIHNIGVVPIIAYAQDLSGLHHPEQLDQAIERLAPFVGVMVLTEWALDSDFISVIEHTDDWYRDSGRPADLCDIVLTAQLHVRQGEPGLPAPGEIPACQKLALGQLDEQSRLLAINEAEAEIRELQALLIGTH